MVTGGSVSTREKHVGRRRQKSEKKKLHGKVNVIIKEKETEILLSQQNRKKKRVLISKGGVNIRGDAPGEEKEGKAHDHISGTRRKSDFLPQVQRGNGEKERYE